MDIYPDLPVKQNSKKNGERSYRNILDRAEDIIFRYRLIPEGRMEYVNPVVAKITGYTAEEFYQDSELCLKLIYPDDRQMVQGITAKMPEVVRPQVLQMRISRKDGDLAWLEAYITPVYDTENLLIAIEGIGRDITERKQSEDILFLLGNALEQARDAVIIRDSDGKVVFANKSVAAMSGLSTGEIYENTEGIFVSIEYLRKMMKRISSEEGWSEEVMAKRKEGSTFPAHLAVSRIVDDNQKLLGMIIIIRDLTERKKMQGQLLQAEKLRVVSQLVAGVAHNLNNSLAKILGNIELALKNLDRGEIGELLKTARQASVEGSNTVKWLIEFVGGSSADIKQTVDINEIIKNVITVTRPRWADEAMRQGIKIEVITGLEELPAVRGNPSELVEVLTNMIFNSMEAMPSGGVINIKSQKKDGGAVISISDTGIGMSEEVKSHLFEPFFTTKGVKYTGLGLARSYGIIKSHGGKLEVESQRGKGTIFSISLPVAPVAQARLPQKAAVEELAPAAINVLIVDDDTALGKMLKRMLELNDIKAAAFSSGVEAIEEFRKGNFNLVITDLGMPDINGYKVAEEIKKIKPGTPVVLLTGWGERLAGSDADKRLVDMIIAKPVTHDVLIDIVKKASKKTI